MKVANAHQSNEKPSNICRGEGGGVGKGGPLWSPAVGRLKTSASMNGSHAPPTGDRKGPPHIHPATLAPTGAWVGA